MSLYILIQHTEYVRRERKAACFHRASHKDSKKMFSCCGPCTRSKKTASRYLRSFVPFLVLYFNILFLTTHRSLFIQGFYSLRIISSRNRGGNTAELLDNIITSTPLQVIKRMSLSTMDFNESSDIKKKLQDVRFRIRKTLEECNRSETSVRLVAVSKTKPVAMLVQAYEVCDTACML